MLMDAHISHFSQEALVEASAQSVLPCIIPAFTTSIFQPLDTHVFARFKLFLRTRLHQAMLSGDNKDLEFVQVMDALMHAMKGVVQRNAWSTVFAPNGFGHRFGVRQHLLDLLDWTSPPDIVAELPSLAQFQSCFPAGRNIPFTELFSGVVRPHARPAKRVRAIARTDASIDDELEPWSKRLRPRSRGRASHGKAKTKVSAVRPSATTPLLRPAMSAGPMMSSSGHTLISLRPFPAPQRRSHAALPDSS